MRTTQATLQCIRRWAVPFSPTPSRELPIVKQDHSTERNPECLPFVEVRSQLVVQEEEPNV